MKDNLISQLNNSRKRLLTIISKLPEKELLVDKWSKKEILSHIAGWGEEGITCIPQILHGEKPKSFKMSINRFNEDSIRIRKGIELKELLRELDYQHKEFIKQIKLLTDEQINSFYGTTLGKKKINILWLIQQTISHDNNHAKELEEKFK